MKRLLAAGISLAVLSTTVPALAQNLPDPANVKGKIVYYTHWTNYIDNGDFDKWEAAFKAKYPNVEDVEVLGIATYAETMTTRLATGDYGDVLDTPASVSNAELPDFFLPITDLDLAKDFYFGDRWAVDGEVYGLTFGVNVEGVVYNKEAFKKAGVDAVPTKYSELKAAYEKLKASGSYPIVTNLPDGWPLSIWDGAAVAISGDPDFFNTLVTDDAPFAADKPYGKSLGILKDLLNAGLTEEDLTTGHWQDSKGWLASGKGATWFLGNWSINQIIAEGATLANLTNYDPNNIGYFPFPYDETGGPYNVNSGPDYGLSVAANTQNADLAKAWLAFLLTETSISQQAGFIPGYKKLEPTLPQLAELSSFNPVIIEQKNPSTAYTNITNATGFTGGSGTRDIMNAADYDTAIADLNAKWAAASARER
jgi:ABC-type glycerol-3-phosphate transport system substrate-binding protein